MTQFCALFLDIYALLAPQRGGMAQCPPNTPLFSTHEEATVALLFWTNRSHPRNNNCIPSVTVNV